MFRKLISLEELEAVIASSSERPVAIFKHSNSCPISFGVRDALSDCTETLHEIVVQTERDLSNRVAELSGINHESPQALVLFDGKVLYSASHYDISGAEIENAIGSSGVNR
jgi:bacillithiol system protein YtxJ